MSLDLSNIKIAKKLPITIAIIAILSAALTGTSAYLVASNNDIKKNKEAVLKTAKLKSESIKQYFIDTEKQVTELANSSQISNALDRFSEAYNELGPDAQNILQSEYIDNNPNPIGQKEKLNFGANNSNYDNVHASFHPWFRTILKTNDFYDIFLFDSQGRNVYTVFKERDFATQLANGKWKDSGLGDLVRKTLKNKDGKPILDDFKPYAPSNDAPAGFVAVPIKDQNGNIKGVLAIQLSIAKVDNAMLPSTANGQTGENIIVGTDMLVRNNSPHSKEPTILKTKLDISEVKKSLAGESGVEITNDIGSKKSIIAYFPVQIMDTKYAVISNITLDEVKKPINKLAFFVCIVTLIIGTISTLIGLWFSKILTNPLKDLTKSMNLLASGDNNVDINGSSRGDELGFIARAVETFRDNLAQKAKEDAFIKEKELKVQIQRREVIDAATSNFERIAGDMLRAVSAASAELNSTAQAMTAAAQRTNQMASSVAAAAEESTVNANTAAGSATELSSAISKIQSSSSESANIAKEAVGISVEAQNAVNELVGAAQSISEVVNLIRGIAEQTNLLALNATIEAARAGAAGAGFAIVAQEVKNLANQTASATDDISNHIGSIQTVVEGASNAMNRITEVIGRINGISSEIGYSVEEQTVVTGEIARNVEEVAIASKSVTEDVIKVTENASETGVAASQVLAASHELSMQAAKLEKETNEFLARVRAA